MRSHRLRACAALAAAAIATAGFSPLAGGGEPPEPVATGPAHVGVASYYGRHLIGRTMADGTPMRPESDSAASRSLPLGSSARVTNLRNGLSAIVTIRDRGPYVRGRIIDLSPRTARQLGMTSAGLAHVEVQPLTWPQLIATD
jgi:rare lipoprotein A